MAASADPPADTWHSTLVPPSPPLPTLVLHTLELTSVCATFSLTFPFPSAGRTSMSHTLTHGLAISVNAVPWQKVLVHIDEDRDDEAIVVLYGLFPGRRYDVEIGVVRAGSGGAQGQVGMVVRASEETPWDSDASDTDTAVEDAPFIPHLHTRNRSSSSLHGYRPAPSSPSLGPSTPPRGGHMSSDGYPPTPLPTLADRLSTLRSTLSSLQSTHAQLSTLLKTTRRDSQRSLALLRSELEGMKRASEKSQGGDMRARQKVLALQEAVRRAERGQRECEDEAISTEGEWVELEGECAALEGTVGGVRAEEEEARRAWEGVRRAVGAREEEREADLAGVRRGWEKWEARRERLQEVVGALEERLEGVLEECEGLERRWEKEPVGVVGDEGAGDKDGYKAADEEGDKEAERDGEVEEGEAEGEGEGESEGRKRMSVWGGLSRRFSSHASAHA